MINHRRGPARRKAAGAVVGEAAAGAGDGLMSAAAVRTGIRTRAGMAVAKRETVVGARGTTAGESVIAKTGEVEGDAAKAGTGGGTGEGTGGAVGGIEVGMIAGTIGAGNIYSLSAAFFFLRS